MFYELLYYWVVIMGLFTIITLFLVGFAHLYLRFYRLYRRGCFIKYPTSYNEWSREFLRYLELTGTYPIFRDWAGSDILLADWLHKNLVNVPPIQWLDVLTKSMSLSSYEESKNMRLAWSVIVRMYRRRGC